MRVYTDGSCRLKMGGWAWWNELTEEQASGVEFPSTNQRMELYAALDAVDSFLDDKELVIVSDSRYVVDCFNHSWYKAWQEDDRWLNRKKEPVKNIDIWQPLINLVEKHGTVKFEWVRGHSGVPGNEMADSLAVAAVLEYNLCGGGVMPLPLRVEVKPKMENANGKRKAEQGRAGD